MKRYAHTDIRCFSAAWSGVELRLYWTHVHVQGGGHSDTH